MNGCVCTVFDSSVALPFMLSWMALTNNPLNSQLLFFPPVDVWLQNHYLSSGSHDIRVT